MTVDRIVLLGDEVAAPDGLLGDDISGPVLPRAQQHVIFRFPVPAAMQRFFSNPDAVSLDPAATQEETTALQAGQFVERESYVTYRAGIGDVPRRLAIRSAYLNAAATFLNDIAARLQAIAQRTFTDRFDGVTWRAGPAAPRSLQEGDDLAVLMDSLKDEGIIVNSVYYADGVPPVLEPPPPAKKTRVRRRP